MTAGWWRLTSRRGIGFGRVRRDGEGFAQRTAEAAEEGKAVTELGGRLRQSTLTSAATTRLEGAAGLLSRMN